MEQKEMTLEQAKQEIVFLSEIQKRQTMEIGNLGTLKISLSVQLQQKDKVIEDLRKALAGMIEATENSKKNDNDNRNDKSFKAAKKSPV